MRPPTPEEEERIVGAMQRALADGTGIEDAARDLERLFAAHQDRVYALCLRIVGDRERAREVAQDAMLAAYAQLPSFRGDARFRTWLLQIARLRSYGALRKRRELLTADGVLDEADPTVPVLTRMRHVEREQLLRDAAAAVLDEQEQEAVHLRYAERLPIDRITALLELDSASGARGLLQRVRRKLRRELRRRLRELGHGSSFVRQTW